MPQEHTIQKDESLYSIAQKYKLPDWRAIYEHPRNEAFRRARPDPAKVQPGDKVFVPDRACAVVFSGGSASLTAKEISRIELAEPVSHAPLRNVTVGITFPGQAKQQRTNHCGMLELELPAAKGKTYDITLIRDETAQPPITYYDEAKAPDKRRKQLPVNVYQLIQLPNKRAVADRIAKTHSISRRWNWGERASDVTYNQMESDWDYDTVVIHHGGNSGSKDPLDIEEEHMDDKGWDDVGYHYLVRPNGAIYEGRHLAFKGSHVEMQNTHKVGILVMGDFEPNWWDSDDEPTAAQLSSVQTLILTLKKEFPTLATLGGHRDFKKTECPGEDLYTRLPALRTATGLAAPGKK